MVSPIVGGANLGRVCALGSDPSSLSKCLNNQRIRVLRARLPLPFASFYAG
jgi:hypothetical protein